MKHLTAVLQNCAGKPRGLSSFKVPESRAESAHNKCIGIDASAFLVAGLTSDCGAVESQLRPPIPPHHIISQFVLKFNNIKKDGSTSPRRFQWRHMSSDQGSVCRYFSLAQNRQTHEAAEGHTPSSDSPIPKTIDAIEANLKKIKEHLKGSSKITRTIIT